MQEKTHWDKRYETGDLPWDTGRPDKYLIEIIEQYAGGSQGNFKKVLEIGCGTGTNTLWLSGRGFKVTGVDISQKAIDIAGSKAAEQNLDVDFICMDILNEKVKGGPFDFVFDRGCFHSFNSPEERAGFSRITWENIRKKGLALSLSGSADGPPRVVGPPRLSALDIVTTVEPFFEILQLRTIHFDSDMQGPPKAWLCLMQKRQLL